ncbi:MAG: NAD-dependent epimerase/dehydratase family protein [Promethearchaeota archaeon]
MSSIINKRILITGGSGSIGTYLIKLLDERNEILNIDLKYPDDSIKDKINFKLLDIANKEELNKVIAKFKPDILFHMAAVFQRTAETIDFRNQCFYSNVVGTHNIFEACVNNNTSQIIFPSSYLIYDSNQYLFEMENIQKEPVSLNERSPINPRNITGVAKLYAERELEFYEKMGLITTSLRIFRVYGPKNEDIIDRWIKSLLSNEEIVVYGKEQVFDYVHAKDCALGCLQAAKMQKNGIFNIGSGKPTSVKTVLDILKSNFGQKFRIKEIESDELMKYEKSYADLSKSRKYLNYFPEITIKDGISSNIEKIKEGLKN